MKTKFLSSRQVNFLLKTLLALVLVGVVYFDLRQKDKLALVWAEFLEKLAAGNWAILTLVILLMPLNWLAETQKWHQFVARFYPFSKWQAYRAVLAGVSFSLFTPNRVGEYGGRILLVKRKHQWKAVIANLVGNFAQILVLLATGLAGAGWFVLHFGLVTPGIVQLYAVAATGGMAVLLFFYFNIDAAVPLARRIPLLNYVKRLVQDVRVLRQYSRAELASVLRWAFVRYLIYSTQYWLLLRFFGIETGVLPGFASIGAIFLLQTSVPLPPVVGLFARGSVAVQVWAFFGANEVSALAATFSLWIINLILPAFAGLLFIFNTNISKTFGYDDAP